MSEMEMDEVEAGWVNSGWTRERCSGCGGHGMVCDYGNGEDFYGADECRECDGSGLLWRSKKGRLAVYPGGPFRGSDPMVRA